MIAAPGDIAGRRDRQAAPAAARPHRRAPVLRIPGAGQRAAPSDSPGRSRPVTAAELRVELASLTGWVSPGGRDLRPPAEASAPARGHVASEPATRWRECGSERAGSSDGAWHPVPREVVLASQLCLTRRFRSSKDFGVREGVLAGRPRTRPRRLPLTPGTVAVRDPPRDR